MFDFFVVLGCGILGLMAHGARNRPWLEWILRGLIGLTLTFELLIAFSGLDEINRNPWQTGILIGMTVCTALLLFFPTRRLYRYLFSAIDSVVSGKLLAAAAKHQNLRDSLVRVFVPSSIPHMVGLFVYISTFAMLLTAVDPDGFKFPGMPLPLPVPIDQLFSYNGLGLVILAFCGVGIFITRKPKEAAERLGLVKPTAAQVGIGVGLIVFSFVYDFLWSILTHNLGGDLATKLATYNAGTFSVVGGFGPSLLLALATALFAGIGEETLIRGSLQPVVGILPAAILHGILHGQFSHAPVFIIQVALWSMFMGIVRRYTNTTTTIIGHSGFNFLTTFLFAFNP